MLPISIKMTSPETIDEVWWLTNPRASMQSDCRRCTSFFRFFFVWLAGDKWDWYPSFIVNCTIISKAPALQQPSHYFMRWAPKIAQSNWRSLTELFSQPKIIKDLITFNVNPHCCLWLPTKGKNHCHRSICTVLLLAWLLKLPHPSLNLVCFTIICNISGHWPIYCSLLKRLFPLHRVT